LRRQFETMAEFYKWEPWVVATHLFAALRSRASEVFHGVHKKRRMSPIRSSRHGVRTSTWQLLTAFCWRHGPQLAGESVLELTFAVKQLSDRLSCSTRGRQKQAEHSPTALGTDIKIQVLLGGEKKANEDLRTASCRPCSYQPDTSESLLGYSGAAGLPLTSEETPDNLRAGAERGAAHFRVNCPYVIHVDDGRSKRGRPGRPNCSNRPCICVGGAQRTTFAMARIQQGGTTRLLAVRGNLPYQKNCLWAYLEKHFPERDRSSSERKLWETDKKTSVSPFLPLLHAHSVLDVDGHGSL
jgi:hypothetical protein